MRAIIAEARKKYHQRLVSEGVLSLNKDGVASNADSNNRPSIAIAKAVAEKLGAGESIKLKGQTAGTKFEHITMQFLADTFPKLQHLRPGSWTVMNLGNQSAIKTSDFAQYEHLAYLSELVAKNKRLSTVI